MSAPRELHIAVRRTARYYTLGDPAAEEIWFVLHGYRQLAGRFIRRFAGIAGAGRLVVAPEAMNRFYLSDGAGPHGPESRVGATWMTREDREADIADIVAYLEELRSRILEERSGDRRPAVRILGFSQGALAAARWAAYGAPRAREVILWASYLPHDLDLSEAGPRLRRSAFTLVAGEADSFSGPEAARRAASQLCDFGVEARVLVHAGGHRVDPEVVRLVAEGPSNPESPLTEGAG